MLHVPECRRLRRLRRSPLEDDEFVARAAGRDVGERSGPQFGIGAFGLVHCGEAVDLGRGLGSDADEHDLGEFGALGPVHGHDDRLAGLDPVAVDGPHCDAALAEAVDDPVSLVAVVDEDGDGLGGGALLQPAVEGCGGGVELLGDGGCVADRWLRSAACRPVAGLLWGVLEVDVRAAFERSLGRLRELGAELVELDEELPDMEPVWKTINHTTWKARFDELIRRDGNRMSSSLVRQVAMAAEWSGADYQRAQFQRTEIFRRVQRWFETYDYLVTPTLSRTALPIDQDLFEPINIDGVEVGELRRNWFPYTMPFNITGHPALTLCCGYDSEGLPIGLQIVGRFRDDASVLRAAALYEYSEDWLSRRPEL